MNSLQACGGTEIPMIDQDSEVLWKIKLEEQLRAHCETLESLERQMQQELSKVFAERQHCLLGFLAVERRFYRRLVAELQKLL